MKHSHLLRIILLLGVSSGCYSYHETGLESITPGTPVRVRISPAEAERLAELRLTQARLMDGTVVANGGDQLMLDTRVGASDPLRGSRALVQRIAVPLAEVREVERRRLDWLRTGAVAGGFALGVGIVAAAALGGGDAEDGPDGGGMPERRGPPRLPFRISLPAF